MPQSPRRNSQTQTNWAEHLSTHRYAAGAVVALLAAYVVAGRGEPPSSIPPGATLIKGLEALAPPRPKGAAPLGGKWPLDVLLVPGYERPPTCEFPCHVALMACEAHTHTCIAPHGIYRSGEYDDEASELRHRRERLLALRRKRAAASEGV